MPAQYTQSRTTLLDHRGKPVSSAVSPELAAARRELAAAKRAVIRAKYDAAQTVTSNEVHWSRADHLDPHTSAQLKVRRTLRSRSRYEVIENNPFLKGTILTIANDFVGSGPKLEVTDERISKERRKTIEKRFQEWAGLRKLRRKLWRAKIAKVVDGETFLRVYSNRRKRYPVELDFQVLECDRISSEHETNFTIGTRRNEIDGVRFDEFENPLQYHVLRVHPGTSLLFDARDRTLGQWIDERFIIHWFRQDRGWLRGIPETTPSLPLCAILRRYTMAVVRHAETAADLTGIIETDGPPHGQHWNTETGELIDDDPFGTFPIEAGMLLNLPFGYSMKQLNAVPLGVQYDEFVGALLREITRPILVPFNVTVGTSKDSNMASAVVDTDIYKGGQQSERYDCEAETLDKIYDLWFQEASLVRGYLGGDSILSDPTFRDMPPKHRWRWDKIGLDHTDPKKVADALVAMRQAKFATDRDIQEGYFNRSVDDWQAEVEEEEKFRKSIEPEPPPGQPQPGENGQSQPVRQDEDDDQ